MGKKSTAQPRPKLKIPPKGIGPVEEPNENDVLCGRGGRINAHQGNVQFRDIVHARKKEYLAPTTKKLEKAHIAAKLVSDIREMNPSGRFLRQEGDGMWYDIGDAKAIKKVGQALREDAPGIRTEFDEDGDDSSGDEGHKTQTGVVKGAQDANVVTPSVKGAKKKKSPPRTRREPRNVVSGRGQEHAQNQQHLVGLHAEAAHHLPDYTIGENHPAHHDLGIPNTGPIPSPMDQWEQHRIAAQHANPFVSQRFEQPLGFHGYSGQVGSNRGLEALDLPSSQRMDKYGYVDKSNTNLTSSSDPTNGPTEQIAFGKPFNTTLVSSGSTNFSSISGLSEDEARLRLSSGSSEERKMRLSDERNRLRQYQATMKGSSEDVSQKQAQGRAVSSAMERSAHHGGDHSMMAAHTGGQIHPHLKHSVSLGSKEAAIRNSLRSSHIDSEMTFNNIRLSQVDEAMEFESLRSGAGNSDVERSLRLSQLAGAGASGNSQGISSGSELTYSLMSVENRLLGSRSFDRLLDSARGTAATAAAAENEMTQMNDSWGSNIMPAPLGEVDPVLSMNSKSTTDSKRAGAAETSQSNLKEVVEFPPRIPPPSTVRSRNESTGNASALTNMSLGTQGSFRSSFSRHSSQYKSDLSSGRSTMSDLSTDLTALDLAWEPAPHDDIARTRLS